MTAPPRSPLGRSLAVPAHYDPDQLFAIARADGRAELGVDGALPFDGVDIWNAWELSWLDARGKPEVGVGEFRVPATSANLIESKSLKLYLGSFHQERVDSQQAFAERVRADLSNAAGAAVEVRLGRADDATFAPITVLDGECIDGLDVAIDEYGPPNARHLRVAMDSAPVEERLVSHLLKSNCPVTGQPDFASVRIAYAGPPIDRAGLLRYLVSFRAHAGFHEQCVERIFIDIRDRCAPTSLSVHARYTRRGGIDINPLRSSNPPRNDVITATPNPRSVRQ